MTDPLPPPLPGPPLPAPEVAPAARQRVVDLLSRYYAHDELTDRDLEARLEMVYAAKTVADLQALTADLPPLGAAPAAPPVRRPDRIIAILSGQERHLTGIAPRDMRIRARLGSVEVDLREATFEPGLTTIDARAGFGYVHIRLPAGVRVESDGRAFFGFFSLAGRGAPESAASTVRITGRALFGFVECIVGSRKKRVDRKRAE